MYDKLKKWMKRCEGRGYLASFSLSHNQSGDISYFLHGKDNSWCILVNSDSNKYKILESII